MDGPGCGPRVGQVREWPGRRAGLRGASRPRWRRAVPRVPSRARSAGPRRASAFICVEGIADLAFKRSQRLFGGLALGHFLVVVRAALGVPVADLGDRGHVDGVVHPPVPRSDSRWMTRLPEDTSVGAVPL